MSIKFIIGNSGSGKTEYMYQQMVRAAEANPRKNYLVIVPEQFTLQTQRKLVELSTNHAIMNVDVLSFKRLAYRVFDDLGMQTLQILEETGKNLVLRKVAQEQAEQLTVLRANMDRMGYIGEVKSLISELIQYNISCEELMEYGNNGKLSSVLSSKLHDVAVMYQGFEDFLEGSYITAEEVLTVLGNVAEESELLRDSVIAFDEFTGFTPIQNQLLSIIMPLADQMIFALTMDAREDFYHSRGSFELFDLPKKTLQILMEIAAHKHIEVLEPVVLSDARNRRFVNAPGLSFLEQNLFRSSYCKRKGEVEDISIHALKNPKEELVFTAREINRLIRSGRYRYREIAVVTGAVDNYSGYVEEVFGKYQIPYFLDTTKDILFHPFIEFIRAALEVIHKDFTYEAVYRFLRCGFCGIPDEQLDQLENYLIATGIRGLRMWKRKWLRIPAGMQQIVLEEMEQLRIQILGIFQPLLNAFSDPAATVEKEMLALYAMITSLDVEQQLWEKETSYLAENQQVKSNEYGQIYTIVMQLLDKYVGILGEEHLYIQEFIEILDAGLDAANVATIPPGYDSVTIGDIERTRLNHIKILFFIGVNDGVIPKSEGAGGIISQYERELLKEMDLPLAPGAREQTYIQRYYLYLNLTKPSEKVYISYVKVDSEGKALRPSYLIGVIRRIFPDLQVKEYGELERIPDYSTLEAARDYLIYGEKDIAWYELARYFMDSEKMGDREVITRLLDALYYQYDGEPISKIVAQALYGRKLEGSVTRLERFAACAYAHFLEYGLRLREREESGFASVDMGNLYHTALERYSRKLEESGSDWFHVSEEQQRDLASQALAETVCEYPDLGIYAKAADSHMVERMQHIFQQTVWALTRQVRKGEFVPEKFEVSFYEPDAREALQFELGSNESLTLKGRIDRIDTCANENGFYVKVIDYKSGRTKFDLVKIYHGTQLQLMVYMNAAMELVEKQSGRKPVPGGVLYYHIDDPVIEAEEGMTEEEAREAILMQLRPDGLVNREEAVYRLLDRDFEGKSDAIPITLKKSGEISESVSHVADNEEFEVLSQYVNTRIRQTGRAILDGDIKINPYKDSNGGSCAYCPYTAVCGMDLRIEGYHYRQLENIGKDEVIDRMRTENAR